MLIRIVLLSIMFVSSQFVFTACSQKNIEDVAQKESTQIHSDYEDSSNILSTESETNPEDTTITEYPVINEDFCKRLLVRLISDDIAVVEGDYTYYFSDSFSSHYIDKLVDSEYYIVDINADGILDIGINFPTNVLATYTYVQEADILEPSVGLYTYTEILGDGQIMTRTSSAHRSTYFYDVMVNGKGILTIVFEKELVGMLPLADGTDDRRIFEYRINSVDVTKEQWDLLIEPLWELRKNSPPTFTYEEIMKGSQ